MEFLLAKENKVLFLDEKQVLKMPVADAMIPLCNVWNITQASLSAQSRNLLYEYLPINQLPTF